MFRYKEFVNHSVTFYVEGETGCHTWDDWKIVPTTRPVIKAPTPKLNIVQIPGTNQEIDLSESLTGTVAFNPREDSLEFVVIKKENWAFVYETIMNYLAGKRVRLVLDDDPDYFYQGRCYVDDWKSNENNSTIVIAYHFDPKKYNLTYSLDNWEFSTSETLTGVL